MARIRHPNVLQVFDNGSMEISKNGNRYPVEFIVMEFIPGDTLRYTMSEEGFYPEQNLLKEWLENYYLPMLQGVKAIHALDMVHRDLKPENVLMDGQIPKITDFGLARSSRLKPVTQSMDVKGTAHYMSPEHFFDFRKADHRADIYSLFRLKQQPWKIPKPVSSKSSMKSSRMPQPKRKKNARIQLINYITPCAMPLIP
jgi:serine/threonine-protein kinase